MRTGELDLRTRIEKLPGYLGDIQLVILRLSVCNGRASCPSVYISTKSYCVFERVTIHYLECEIIFRLEDIVAMFVVALEYSLSGIEVLEIPSSIDGRQVYL